MKLLHNLFFRNKRVILRADFNVPVAKGAVTDGYRIEAVIPTIRYLLRKRASIIIISHRGRPNGRSDKNLSLKPVASYLAKILKFPILFAETLEEAFFISQTIKPGDILMVENIRFFKGEVENKKSFIRQLAALGDVYVNDAFGDAHRKHASIIGIAKYMPHAAGFLLAKEVKMLSHLLKKLRHPYLAIIGGAKITTKLPLIRYFLKKADWIIVGGGIANTILAAKHLSIGKSIADKKINLSWLRLTDKKFHLPIDALVTRSFKKTSRVVRAIGNIKNDEYIADIGPDSITLFQNMVKKAKTIVWNGPLGYIENEQYARGTKEVLKSIARSRADVFIGGGDLHLVIQNFHLQKKIKHISTGGGAMLEYLVKKTLPGIQALK